MLKSELHLKEISIEITFATFMIILFGEVFDSFLKSISMLLAREKHHRIRGCLFKRECNMEVFEYVPGSHKIRNDEI